MKTVAILAAACAIGTCGGYYGAQNAAVQLASIETSTGIDLPVIPGVLPAESSTTLSGDYLSSIFAQQHHDWDKATQYLNNIMKATPNEPILTKRAMVLSMGAGNVDEALKLAKENAASKDSSALSELFLAVGAFHDKDYKDASAHIKKIPAGSLSEFVMPLLQSWADAGNGIYNVSALTGNSIHLHHAVLISDFMGKKQDTAAALKKLLSTQEVTLEDLERIANLYAHIGRTEEAKQLYQKILEQWPDHPTAGKKLAVLKNGQKLETIIPVKSPEEGVATALYDMSNLLFREYADDSARVFAQMALYLAPDMLDARLLLAAIDARNGRYDAAIASYKMVPENSEYFLDAGHRISDLLAQAGRMDEALAELDSLFKDHGDIEALILTGDLYRQKENFTKAIEVYNEAEQQLGGTVPKEYWNLLYVRGISYERAGQWDKAEADLKQCLVYQPNHPFVLNYLAYAWADKGVHLDQALELLRKASNAQPDDGYIVDSLGWTYYRMARYDDGLPALEKAVELLPYDPVINDHLGDAYWQVGRKREARFQWQRAENYSQDAALNAAIDDKLQNGLTLKSMAKEAHAQPPVDGGDGVTAIP